MGDSSCILQDFSHAPENATGETEVNSVLALGGSISFGRFLSDSLDWGKWSSFCQKKYLEEVEKYSTPGSVAQKKAYFEAHYRKSATQKSASLLEQANSMATVPEKESNNRVESNDGNHSNSFEMKPELEELNSEVAAGEAVEAEMTEIDMGFSLSAKELNLGEENYRLEREKVEKCGLILEDKILVESPLQIESSEIVNDVENGNKVNETELSRTNPLEKQPLKEISVANQENEDSIEKKPIVPILKSSVIHRPSRIPPSPASKLLSPAKPVSSIHCMKENKSTPSSKKNGTGSNEKKKSTPSPRSLHMSINFTQSRSGSTTPLISRNSPIIKKVEELKVASTSSKACQVRSHHFKTPTRASSNGPKLPSLTPQSEHGRIRTTLEQTLSGRNKVDAKLHTLYVDYSKSSSIRGNRAQTEVASSSLSFKTDERVEKRKEFFHNLEDKVDRKEAKKLPLQETPKEKGESEIKKLRQSLCFKARPLPDFYRNIEPAKHELKKIPLTRPQSPKLGRKSNSKANSGPNSLPPSRSSIKGDMSMPIRENSSRISSRSIILIPNKHKLDSVSSSNK